MSDERVEVAHGQCLLYWAALMMGCVAQKRQEMALLSFFLDMCLVGRGMCVRSLGQPNQLNVVDWFRSRWKRAHW